MKTSATAMGFTMTIDLFGGAPGPTNSLMDVPGLGLGHAICDGGAGDSGVTVVVVPEGAVASVDVRGGGPGTRETDLLSPENTVGAICLLYTSPSPRDRG